MHVVSKSVNKHTVFNFDLSGSVLTVSDLPFTEEALEAKRTRYFNDLTRRYATHHTIINDLPRTGFKVEQNARLCHHKSANKQQGNSQYCLSRRLTLSFPPTLLVDRSIHQLQSPVPSPVLTSLPIPQDQDSSRAPISTYTSCYHL